MTPEGTHVNHARRTVSPASSPLPLFLAILGCLPALTLAAPAIERPSGKPNVIFFLVDDMGWMDSSAYGSQYYETPNMERLAREGIRFTDAYASPVCSPTRASILTGQYPARHHVIAANGHRPPQPEPSRISAPPDRPLIQPPGKNYLEPEHYTLAEALRDAGYRTAHLGKWHLGVLPRHWPNQNGFDISFHAAPDAGPPSYFSPYGVRPSGQPSAGRRVGNITDGPKGEYITDRLTAEALGFIRANRQRPFFLVLSHYAVHGPWGHKEEITRRFTSKTDPRGEQGNPIMASMLKSVDDSLRRILDALDDLQLSDRTLLIFYSDNGGNVHANLPGTSKTERARLRNPDRIARWRLWAGDLPPTNNAPLRAGKASLYEGGSRVPLIIRWPGVIESGVVSDAVVAAIDFYPTLLDLLGLSRPEGQIFDGISFAPLLTDGVEPPNRALFNFFPHEIHFEPGGVAVRRGNWKLIRWFETDARHPKIRELYDLRDDLGETKNVAQAHSEIVDELDVLIDRFLEESGAVLPWPNPAFEPLEKPKIDDRSPEPTKRHRDLGLGGP